MWFLSFHIFYPSLEILKDIRLQRIQTRPDQTRWMEIFVVFYPSQGHLSPRYPEQIRWNYLLSFVLLNAVDHPGQLLSYGGPGQSDSFTMMSPHPNDNDIVVTSTWWWLVDLPAMRAKWQFYHLWWCPCGIQLMKGHCRHNSNADDWWTCQRCTSCTSDSNSPEKAASI